MILADENINQFIISAIINSGINVYSIREQNPGITDKEAIELSVNPYRIILTEDKDFGEWVYAHKRKEISVIFLRYNYQETSLITEILIKLLKEKKLGLMGKYTTITSEKIRIRSLK